MKALVIQADDRRRTADHRALHAFMDKTRRVCELDRDFLCYRRATASEFADVPPYWRKVFLIGQAMTTVDNGQVDAVDWILWIDSDAWIHDAKALRRLLRRHHDDVRTTMIIGPDPPMWPSPFNAGVFAVRNDRHGLRLIREWMRLYDPSTWTLDRGGKWTSSGPWAGETYEQGAFWKRLMPDPRWSSRIASVPSHVLCETDWQKPRRGTVAIHLAGHFKQNMDLMFSSARRARFQALFSKR